jgi:hypothetical protein
MNVHLIGCELCSSMPMDSATTFVQIPTTPEPVIAQVRRQLADEAWSGLVSHGRFLDRVADRAVRELWGSRIKTFVPVLALRQAHEMLRPQDALIAMYQPQRPRTDESAAAPRPLDARQRRDGVAIDEDAVSVDDPDVPHL